ncbi:MAG: hypothetical protein EOP55_09565, partial [Sphingobacteriales bacterium]
MRKNYFFYFFKYGLTVLFLLTLSIAHGQQAAFTGRVVDEDNEAVAGATLQVKGTNQMVATDAKGAFQISSSQTALT